MTDKLLLTIKEINELPVNRLSGLPSPLVVAKAQLAKTIIEKQAIDDAFMPSKKKMLEVIGLDRQQEIAQIIEPELHNLGDAFTCCNRVKFYRAIDRIRLALKGDMNNVK